LVEDFNQYVKSSTIVSDSLDILRHSSNESLNSQGGVLTEELNRVRTIGSIPYRVKSMAISEQKLVLDMIKKHGQDYEAMQRDMQLNIYQKTAQQLKKRVLLYQQLTNL